jgi:predicted lactoylglutathione lyase
MTHPERKVECTIPVLPVRDLAASIRFYTEILDFKLDWSGGVVCSVSRDGKPIMLFENLEGASGTWVWIGLEDDSLFEVYKSRGVKVRQEPKNYEWAYEMKFEDIDGNVLWMGTDTKKDMPLED